MSRIKEFFIAKKQMIKNLKLKQEIEDIDIQFMSDTSAAMLQGIPYRLHTILWISIIFLLTALIWAHFATLDVVTVAQGKVIPSRNMQTIQNLEGGIVKEILVRVGDIVEKGQSLIVIDDTRFTSSLKEGEVQIYALQAKIDRLNAQIRNEPLKFSSYLENNYPQYVQNETNLYHTRQRELEVKLNILKDEVQQRSQELKGSLGRKLQLQRSLNLVRKELTLTKPLLKDGAVAQVDILRLERTLNDLEGELEQTVLSIPKMESHLASAYKKSEELKLGHQSESLSDLNATKAEYARLVEGSKAAIDRVKRTIVRSPVKGTVNQVKVKTVQGAIVQPGENLVEIVPLGDQLLIEANIRPSDIGFLRPGLPATIKISAYDYSIYGGLRAVVENISPDTITDDAGNSFYKIVAHTTDRNYLLGKNGEHYSIVPGVPVTVDVQTDKNTVLNYLLKPIIKAKRTAMRER